MNALEFDREWRSQFQRLEGAYAPLTMLSYHADVEAFEDWCMENDDGQGVPPRPPRQYAAFL